MVVLVEFVLGELNLVISVVASVLLVIGLDVSL